jgi:hypothetical protein
MRRKCGLFSGSGYRWPGPRRISALLGWKDLHLVLQLAKESETPMPIASLLANRSFSALAKGRSDLDWAALALNAAEDAGLSQSPLQEKGQGDRQNRCAGSSG